VKLLFKFISIIPYLFAAWLLYSIANDFLVKLKEFSRIIGIALAIIVLAAIVIAILIQIYYIIIELIGN